MLKKIIYAIFLSLSYINGFVHPGIFVNKQQLDFMKTQVLNNIEPHITAFNNIKNSRFGSLTYQVQGPPSDGIIECGSFSNPNKGCSAENSDSTTALAQSLLWYITGNKQYASNAINIMDTYALKLTGGHTNSNGPLQTGWTLQKFPVAAEIIYYTKAGWPETSFNAFKECLRTQYLPSVQVSSLNYKNGNWAMSMVSGVIAVGVLLDNQTIFDNAIKQLEDIIPAYYYNFPEDETTPKTSPIVSPKWNKQKIFNSETSGICQETCRDLQHMQFGAACCFYGLETAYIQGVDLYPKYANRLTTMMEFNTGLIPTGFTDLGGEKIKISNKYICRGKIDVVANPTFEVAYNAYHNRLGYSLPNTLTYILNSVRKLDFTSGHAAMDHTNTFETLHHGFISDQQKEL